MHLPSRPRMIAAGLSAALLGSLVVASPAVAADGASYDLVDTVAAGSLTRAMQLDDDSGRLYLPVDRGSSQPGAVTWLDATTRTAAAGYEVATSEPSEIVVDAERGLLSVLYYRSGTLDVLSTTDGSLVRTITGVPTYPGGMVHDADTGMLYVLDSGLVPVNPMTGVVGDEIAITTQRYPLLRDAVYDATNRLIWISEGRGNVITAYSTVSGQWLESVAVPIGAFEVDGAPLGGRPSSLAVDEGLGLLHVVVQPTLNDDWVESRVVTIDTTTAQHRGTPIVVGDTARDIEVNPVSHEIYTADGFSNTLSVIDPSTWQVSDTIDFTAEGVTAGAGTTAADTWEVEASRDGSTVYVSHPYGTARVSVIERTGTSAPAVVPPVAPGQDGGTEEPVEETPWTGPAASPAAEAPEGAVVVDDGALEWSVNDYMYAWEPTALGSVGAQDDGDYRFADGTGWYDADTGAMSIAWADGIHIQHYPALAPEVTTTIGNPVLTIDADGVAELTVDAAWTMPDRASDGWRRVALATFTGAEVVLDGETVAITATPDYEGRTYTTESGTVSPASWPHDHIEWLDPGMRAWWYSSGATMDAEKVPNPLTLSFTAAAAPEDGGEQPGDGTEQPGDGSGEPVDGSDGSPQDPGTGSGGGAGEAEAAAPTGQGADVEALPTTGGSIASPFLVVAAAMLLLGGAALAIGRMRATLRD